MRIAVLDDYADAFRALGFAEQLPGHDVVVFRDTERDPARLAARLADVDVVLLTQQRSALRRATIERVPRLKLIVQTGRYLAHVDVGAARERGIAVATTGPATGTSVATAELAWALVLAAVRRVPDEAARLRAGAWQGSIGDALAGKTLGVYGYGRIGARVARYGRAFDMRVVAFGRDGSADRARADGVEVAPSREALFAESDVLSLHVALAPETRGLVTRADLARMKPTALFVNTARAALVEEGALVAALRAGRPGMAAVDVFEDEPVLDGAHPLLSMPNVVATPHLGYSERGALASLWGPAVEAILAFARGEAVKDAAKGTPPRSD